MSSANESPFTLPPFANKLIQSGYINLPQMQQALMEKKKSGRSLFDILQEITGRSLPSEFVRQYKKEQLFNLKILYGIDVFDPETYSLDWKQIQEIIHTIIPLDVCRRHKMFPLKKRNSQPPTIVVALINPKDPETLNVLKQILRPKQMKAARKVITQQDYNNLIEQYLATQNAQEATQIGMGEEELETLVDIADIFDDVSAALRGVKSKQQEDIGFTPHPEDGPVVTLVNNIILKAIENKATEIHIEPQDHDLKVQFRLDGVLSPSFEHISKEIAAAVVSQIKSFAQLDIHQRNIPQKGRMQKSFLGRKIDFWISTLPNRYGETVIIRILDAKAISLDLEELITNEGTRQLIKHFVNRSSGLLLVTGPESSGISTTLYALLAQRNQLGVNIATVENPIERVLPGITQVEVSEDLGKDYDTILQSFLHQDVDVIGVDQIRGRHTLKTVVDAALSHLVLATLPTLDAASTISRLTKMGVNASTLSDILIGVINQRLVRRVCPVCRLSYQPNPGDLARFGLSASLRKQISCYKANSLTPEAIEQARGKGRLCRQCNGIGYKGQVGVYEVMGLSPRIKTLISQNVDTENIKQAAIQERMKPLLNYALDLVLQGHTTLEELDRVFPEFAGSNVAQPSAIKSSSSISPQISHRLQEMEKLLESLIKEFKNLKQELDNSSEDYTVERGFDYEELKDYRDWESIKKDLESDRETMVSQEVTYEELTDPGDWEHLKQDLDPDKETMVAGEDSDDDDFPQFEINSSFRSVTDPW